MLKIGVINYVKKSPIKNEENIYYNHNIYEKIITTKLFFLTNKYFWYDLTSPKSKLELFYIIENEDNDKYYNNKKVILKTYLINIFKKTWKKKYKLKKLKIYFSNPKNLLEFKLNLKKRKRLR
jgi:hypothetical protein